MFVLPALANNVLLTFLVGPACKKMNDLSEAKMFKASAFEPSDEELTKAARARRKQRSRVVHDEPDSDVDIDMGTPRKTFTGSKIDLDDSSDEEMPDVADLFAGREGKKIKNASRKGGPDKVPAAIEDVSIAVPYICSTLMSPSLSRMILSTSRWMTSQSICLQLLIEHPLRLHRRPKQTPIPM